MEELDYWKTGSTIVTTALACLLGYLQYRITIQRQSFESLKSQHDSDLRSKEIEISTLEAKLSLKDEWHKLEQLRIEINTLANQVGRPVSIEQIADSIVHDRNVSLPTTDAGIHDIQAIEQMKSRLRQLDVLRAKNHPSNENNWRQTVAASAFANHDFATAADQLDKISRVDGANWRVPFTRGVAFANQRKGAETDLEALKAYSEAIAVLPADLPGNIRAKLFIYRGAMLKRLGRLREAQADFEIGEELASSSVILADAAYNLAAVAAQLGDTDLALRYLDKLDGNSGFWQAVAAHRDDYFSSLAGHSKFESMLARIHHSS